MNCEEGKERVSSLRQQMGKDEHEYQRNSTAGNAKSRPIEGHRKNVSSFHPRADHLTINGSEREKSQKNISR